ncbi:MAG: hypothetical protein IPN29_08805 [Saprospiraceae bacterium]|nr:hypothetical protein [Saprospiraceae bacterium]
MPTLFTGLSGILIPGSLPTGDTISSAVLDFEFASADLNASCNMSSATGATVKRSFMSAIDFLSSSIFLFNSSIFLPISSIFGFISSILFPRPSVISLILPLAVSFTFLSVGEVVILSAFNFSLISFDLSFLAFSFCFMASFIASFFS